MDQALFLEMMQHCQGDPAQIQHFTKVYAYAALIGQLERLPERERRILETAALVHDIGINASLKTYGDDSGEHQQELGPPLARDMLQRLGRDAAEIERVCYLVGHHHTYQNIDGADYQILVEADFLVNLLERGTERDAIEQTYRRIFRTTAGRRLCRLMFGLQKDSTPAKTNASHACDG